MKKEFIENSIVHSSESKKILVLAPNWLGDAVMSLPFFLVLRTVFPAAFISVACRNYVSEIYLRNQEIDRILVYSKNGLKSKISLIRKLKTSGPWDICFLLSPSFSSALSVFLAGVKRRIGYGTDFRSIFLTKAFKGNLYKKGHLSNGYIKLISLVSGKLKEFEFLPSITPTGNWTEIIKTKGIKGKYAVFSAGASYGHAKLWPGENYLKLAKLLYRKMGFPVVMVGTEKERVYLNSIVGKENKQVINLAGKCDVKELVAILKGAQVVVGNDSGSVHLSAALGVPTVSLFGSTSPFWTGPRGINSKIINSNIECSPCFKKECPKYNYAKCFDDITISRVYKAVCEVVV
ncbi:lipopolysaccharide heptosyltransferase II [bacterium]|nr:lipopolysaccharide heptosyltransferase II [bacterium]